MAPERISGKMETYDTTPCKAADMWSVGVIFYFLISGKLPIDGRTSIQIYEKVKKGVFSFTGHEWARVPASAKDLISCLMKIEPLERIDAADSL